MLMQASCDVSIDGCEEVAYSELVRPEADDFNSLTRGYITEFFVLFIPPLFPLLMTNADFRNGDELTLLILPCVYVLFFYTVPFALSVLYMIFGDDVFLFSAVDSILVSLIEHWVSNTQLYLVLTIPYYYYRMRSSAVEVDKLTDEDAG